MPSHSELPGEIKRNKFIKALKRLGFSIDESGGNGSHYKATWPPTQKSITIPVKLSKPILSYVLKEIERYSGVAWEQIKDEL
jgi:predicted RNA binding protein YcfA (HicA-like mRNA interferase family)